MDATVKKICSCIELKKKKKVYEKMMCTMYEISISFATLKLWSECNGH